MTPKRLVEIRGLRIGRGDGAAADYIEALEQAREDLLAEVERLRDELADIIADAKAPQLVPDAPGWWWFTIAGKEAPRHIIQIIMTDGRVVLADETTLSDVDAVARYLGGAWGGQCMRASECQCAEAHEPNCPKAPL